LADESALTIAGKRRHLFLLQKIRENKPLSRAELAELQQYEDPMSKDRKPERAPEKAPAVPPEASGVQFEAGLREPVSIVKHPQSPRAAAGLVRLAGMRFESMADAEVRLQWPGLTDQIAKSPLLIQAWEKGRRLRAIHDLAGTPICMEEASKRIGMGEGGLLKLYKRDPEVRDLWDRAKLDMVIGMKKALMTRATSGNANALATVEKILAGEFGAAGGKAAAVDFTRLSPTQMELATDIKRAQLDRWHKKNGLPRNGDRTYSLPVFLAWRVAFERDKLARNVGTPGVDPLREQKARKAKIEADLAEGRVVPFATHERGYLARGHVLKQLLSADRAEEWASLHEGLTALQLKGLYLEAFDEVLRQFCVRVDDVPELPPAVQAKLDEAFELLKGTADERR